MHPQTKGLSNNYFQVYKPNENPVSKSPIRKPGTAARPPTNGNHLPQPTNNKAKLKIKNGTNTHHHLRIRPDDDVQSQHSTLTFYQSSFPTATAQVIQKNYGNQIYDSKAPKNVKKKKEIIDEVKKLIAQKKMLKALKANVRIMNFLKLKVKTVAEQAQTKIARRFLRIHYRNLFRKRIFIATLYLETSPVRVDPGANVQVFGSFTKNPWADKIDCKYDKFFKCFKADKVRIMIGHEFKFIINDGKQYLVSNRYFQKRDSSGNFNNVYEPRRINGERKKQLKQSVHSFQTLIQEEKLMENIIHQQEKAQHHSSNQVRYIHFDNIPDTLTEEDKGVEFKMFQRQHQAKIASASASNINRSYQDFMGQFEKFYLSYSLDFEKQSHEILSQFQQGSSSDQIEQSYNQYSELQPLLRNANLFDMSLAEPFEELTPIKLQQKTTSFGGLQSESHKTHQHRLMNLDSRYRLNSISEQEELRINKNVNNQSNENFFKESHYKKQSSSSLDCACLLEDDNGPDMRIVTGAFKLGKVPDQCEDAFFITDRGFGVADGVSGWNDYGFSSSLFANQLMDNCKSEIEGYIAQSKESQQSKQIMKNMRKSRSFLSMENLDVEEQEQSEDQNNQQLGAENNSNNKIDLNGQKQEDETVVLHPHYILEKAFSKVVAVGSSTAMVAIRNQKTINIANLGDSGFILIRFRNGEAYAAKKSAEQQHSFNVPFQLSILPGDKELELLKHKGRIEELKKLRQVLRRKDYMCQDMPEHAEDYQEELQDGDVIVSATDGVFDNLFNYEIFNCVRDFKLKHKKLCTKEQADKLAEIIVKEAYDKVKDKRKKTPYQRKYKKTYNATWEGGKEDDITALVTFAIAKHQHS